MGNLERRLENFGAEKIFIAVFLIFGVMILFMRPPYRLMDEPVHFARAWQISEGIFLSPLKIQGVEKNFGWKNCSPDAATEKLYSASVPASLVPDKFIFDVQADSTRVKVSIDELKKFLSTPLNVDEREEGLIPNTGVYPPPTYLPQAIAALFGRVLNLNAGIIFYLMGLSGLIFVGACVYWSMKFLPEAKPLIFLLAMMPMFLVEAASTSADAVTFGVCFLGTAWLLSLKNSTEKFSHAEIFGLMILSIMLACSKSVYGTILLLYFLIPRERVGLLKKFLSLGAAILALNLLTSLIWTWLAVGMTGVELATIKQYLGVENVDAAAQKIFIAEHPAEFFAAIIHSLDTGKFYYLFGFMGTWGANGELFLPPIFYALYGLTLIFFALTNGLNLKLNERGLLIFAAAVSTFALFLYDYLIWTPIGADYVKGVQGRYFIPIAPMIFGALSVLPTMRHKNLIALTAGIFSGVATLSANFYAFY
ncbi:MAG: DUF2142 domain-containing protein [Selenomonadaceae bacterium]|nr:DUF2142 domain-containing protein [Selenomonadaceae bacterium]